ncbi:hypothetical protein [Streptomyces sp. NPDC001388]|uniref:hypothetical protein n=1 Tax=Streptomyces sp. NPDC001388 TaxID=3364568 RepID=UPI00368C9607
MFGEHLGQHLLLARRQLPVVQIGAGLGEPKADTDVITDIETNPEGGGCLGGRGAGRW